VNYAGFGPRFVAFLIDWVILFVVQFIIGFVLGFVMGMLHLPGQLIALVAQVVGLAIMIGYFGYFESSEAQASIGKKAMGLKVTDLEGNKLSFAKAAGRAAAKIISAIILFIGFIMAAFTPKKQALHDMIAGCLVLKK
jgi:uncharacterized RDD family membrane protein YckC